MCVIILYITHLYSQTPVSLSYCFPGGVGEPRNEGSMYIPAVLLLALEAFSYLVSVSQQQQSAASTPGDKEGMTYNNMTSSQNLYLYMYHEFWIT